MNAVLCIYTPVLLSSFRYWLPPLKLSPCDCGKAKEWWKWVHNIRAMHVLETAFFFCNKAVSTSESGAVSSDQCFTLQWNQIQTDMALIHLWVPWNLEHFRGQFGSWHNFHRALGPLRLLSALSTGDTHLSMISSHKHHNIASSLETCLWVQEK